MGATDVQVARLFQRRIALDALFGGLIGFILAALVLIGIGERVSALGSELLGSATMPAPAWGILVALPAFGVLLAMLVARLTILERWGGCCDPLALPPRSLLALIAYAIGFALFAMTLPGPAGDERTDAIVVLTGGTGRLDRGFDLVQRGLARRMLISGVRARRCGRRSWPPLIMSIRACSPAASRSAARRSTPAPTPTRSRAGCERRHFALDPAGHQRLPHAPRPLRDRASGSARDVTIVSRRGADQSRRSPDLRRI